MKQTVHLMKAGMGAQMKKTKHKHTPGPCEVNYQDIIAPQQDVHDMVATVYFDGVDFRQQAESNARLIAAAPDLLEAAKECVAWLRTCEATSGTGNYAYHFRELNKVIAKAEGR